MISFYGFSQNATNTYTKRVLENTEVDLISSFYGQDGDNAAVTGGIGTEKLTDIVSTITVSIPLNANDIFTIDAKEVVNENELKSGFDETGSGPTLYSDAKDQEFDNSFTVTTAGSSLSGSSYSTEEGIKIDPT